MVSVSEIMALVLEKEDRISLRITNTDGSTGSPQVGTDEMGT